MIFFFSPLYFLAMNFLLNVTPIETTGCCDEVIQVEHANAMLVYVIM